MRAWFRKNQYQATCFSTIAKWERGSGRTSIGQLVSQLSLCESMVQEEPISGNSFLNYRYVRAWFRENQYRAPCFSTIAKWEHGSGRTSIGQLISTIAKWEHGSGRTNIRQLVSQLSLSESVVQGEPVSGNLFLNYRYVRAWFRKNQYQATCFSTIAKWEHGSGRTNIRQLVSQLSLSESVVQGEPWDLLRVFSTFWLVYSNHLQETARFWFSLNHNLT